MAATNPFRGCRTQREIRARYEQLRSEHGSGASAQEIYSLRSAYAAAAGRLAVEPEKARERIIRKQFTLAEVARKIEAAVMLAATLKPEPDGVEVIDLWVWLTFVEKPPSATLERLKRGGYLWHRKQRRWYFPGIPSRGAPPRPKW